MIGRKKKIGMVCCSNGLSQSYSEKLKMLEETLLSIGLQPVFSTYLYERDGAFSGTAKERAQALMDFYADDEIEEIFDISGGDIANGILPYLDYDVIAKSNKRFWGYSDLTTVLNGIYAKTEKISALYQIRNLLSEFGAQQLEDVRETLFELELDVPALGATARESDDLDGDLYVSSGKGLFKIKYDFMQGHKMRGIVIGGNIRCFLKLAGTEYMPDFEGKILVLESRGGTVPQMETYLSQLQQLGAFDKISGILLGTFTQMEVQQCKPAMVELIRSYVNKEMPIAVTRDIGHGKDAKAIEIGKMLYLERK